MSDTAQSEASPDSLECRGCGRELPLERSDQLCPYCLLAAEPSPESTAGSSSYLPRFDLPQPEQLQPYFPLLRIDSLIGYGGMGAVYRARQEALGRDVAIKVLPPEIAASPGFTDRFLREAQALARLSHRNVVSVYEHGTAGPYAYLIIELVEGVNLRELMAGERMQPDEALRIISQLCDALQFAHEHGVIHRDVKPENILLDESGTVKITDFGIAKLATAEAGAWQTRTQQVMGTWHYMAPEQIERPREVDHRADLYSLGVVFYELLTGELPLGRFDPPSWKARTGRQLDRVILRSLEKEPSRRYASARAVREDLGRPSGERTSEKFADAARRVGREFGAAESRVRNSVAQHHRGLVEFGVTLLCVIFYVLLLAWIPMIGDSRSDELPVVIAMLVAATFVAAWVLKQVLQTAPLPERLEWLATPIFKIAEFPTQLADWVGSVFQGLEPWRTGLLTTGLVAFLLAVLLFVGVFAVEDDLIVWSFLFVITSYVAIRVAIPWPYQPQSTGERWLVYPPLLVVLVPLTAFLLLWPVAVWTAALSDQGFARWWYAVMLPPNPAVALRLRAAVASCAVLETGWLLFVSLAVAVWPDLARWWLRPFLDDWEGEGRWGIVLFALAFFVLALFSLLA